MTRLTFALQLALLSTMLNAAPLTINTIESFVLAHAYVEKSGGELIHDDSRITDLVHIGGETRVLRDDTWRIPNKLGTGFRIAVAFKSIPLTTRLFDLEITYPEMTLPSGEKRSRLNRAIHLGNHDGNHLWLFAYYFDFPYETTPGEWNIKIRAQGHEVHHSTFTVVEHQE